MATNPSPSTKQTTEQDDQGKNFQGNEEFPASTEKLIADLQKKRNSKVISYIISTKEGTSFQIADDAVRIIYDHLVACNIRKTDKLDLYIHSFGGAGVVPWKLVNLIREFTPNFEVLVPFKAYSAATMIALGANGIVMHPMAELGPIDPKVGNEFNPINPQGQPVGINVEDVAAYIAFVKDFVGISHEDELIQALNTLTNNVHPLAIGNVHRFYAQSRMMASKLMKLHMSDPKDEHIIDEIAETLTSKLFFHGHPINRAEAETLKLKVVRPSKAVADLMWELYEKYENDMDLKVPFNPREILNQSASNQLNYSLVGAYIESETRKDEFFTDTRIERPAPPPNLPMPIQIQASMDAIAVPLNSGWRRIR